MKRPANPEPLDQIERLLKRIRQLEDIITTHRNDAKKINDLAVMIHRLLFALGEKPTQKRQNPPSSLGSLDPLRITQHASSRER